MRNNSYTARRRENRGFSGGSGGGFSAGATSGWMRNRNTVRHSGKNLGTMSFSVLLGMAVMILGVLYVSQGTRATSYDYEISSMEAEIEELEAQKEDLAVEKARLTAIATSAKSTVAAVMDDGEVSGYAE